MKISVTNFYNVRFFKPWQIGFSTAMWDPTWWHDGKEKQHIFVDKRGVLNGLRSEVLTPAKVYHGTCKNCDKAIVDKCPFLSEYEAYLFSLDKQATIMDLELSARCMLSVLNQGLKLKGMAIPEGKEAEIVLLVHEAKDNPCSERWALKKFFECDEWQKED